MGLHRVSVLRAGLQLNATRVGTSHARSSLLIPRVSSVYSTCNAVKGGYGDRIGCLGALQGRHGYATDAVSRPKAHTGRATTTTRKPKAKKAGATKTAIKTKAKPKKKAAAKPKKKKAAVKKPKRKTKTLTEAQKQKKADQEQLKRVKGLITTALVVPKGLPSTAWTVLTSQRLKSGTKDLGGSVKQVSQEFKSLAPEQLEALNHEANANKATNARSYQAFIDSHSPADIYNANLARSALTRMRKAASEDKAANKPLIGGTRNVSAHRWTKLKDDRQVPGLVGSYAFFSKERNDSGDLNGMDIATRARLIAREWKELSVSSKKPYEDAAETDKQRYYQERKSVLGLDPPKPSTKKATASA